MFKRILMALKFATASEFALVKGVELANTPDVVFATTSTYPG